jgi:hypothetical protein
MQIELLPQLFRCIFSRGTFDGIQTLDLDKPNNVPPALPGYNKRELCVETRLLRFLAKEIWSKRTVARP